MADLHEITDFIARDSPARAETFVDELQARCAVLGATPEIYPRRDDLAPGLRMMVHGRYLLLYRSLIDEDIVRIERIVHGSRQLPGLV